jgi:hypothetical protein
MIECMRMFNHHDPSHDHRPKKMDFLNGSAGKALHPPLKIHFFLTGDLLFPEKIGKKGRSGAARLKVVAVFFIL